MIYYKILPKCAPTLALTYVDDPENLNVALLKADSDDLDTQLWTPIEVIKGTNHGFALLNKYSNLVLAAPQNNAPLQAISQKDLFLDDKVTDAHMATWKWTGLGYGGLQLQRNTDMNLNVFTVDSCKSGDTVGVWNWSDGKDKEVWEFRAVLAP